MERIDPCTEFPYGAIRYRWEEVGVLTVHAIRPPSAIMPWEWHWHVAITADDQEGNVTFLSPPRRKATLLALEMTIRGDEYAALDLFDIVHAGLTRA